MKVLSRLIQVRSRYFAIISLRSVGGWRGLGTEQVARWYRFLPSGETPADQEIMKRIAQRFQKLGGMTPELSKKIGM